MNLLLTGCIVVCPRLDAPDSDMMATVSSVSQVEGT